MKNRFDITLSNRYHDFQSLPYPRSTKSIPVCSIMKRRKKIQRDRLKIGVGTSVTLKVGKIDEKIREGESRSMRKELFDSPPSRTPLPRHTSWNTSYRYFF